MNGFCRGSDPWHYDDAAGSLTNVVYSDSTPAVSFAYDRLGRQLSARTGDRQVALYAYDPATLSLASEAIIDLQSAITNILSRATDALGRPSGISLSDAGTPTPPYSLTYSYDPSGRFHSITASVCSASSVVAYSYDPATGQLAGWDATQVGSGVTNRVRKAFEPARGLVAAVSNSAFAGGAWSPVSSFDYANDALGRRTARTDTLAGVVAVATNLFAYNARSEVESAQMRYDTYSYDYDEIGNRLWASNQWWGVDYTANQLNQYEDYYDESWRGQFAYDADGNMVAKDNDWWFQEWDAENRLVAAGYEDEEGYEEGGQWIVFYYEAHRTEYRYDHLSRRIGKTVLSRFDDPEAPWTTNAVYRYVFDGWNLVAEHIQTPALPNTHTNHYVWGLDVSGSLQGAGGVGGLVAALPDAPSANTQFLHEPLGIDRRPDPVAWAAVLGGGLISGWTIDGWVLQYLRLQEGCVKFAGGTAGVKAIRSPVVQGGIGTVHFRAKPSLTLPETHKVAVETSGSANGPWSVAGEVTVPVQTQYASFHVPVNCASAAYVRLRRTTVSTDQQSWIILSGIAISRYSEVSLALFPAYDGNGNVTELVDANGVRQARYEYTPFGELTDCSGNKAWSFPFRFSTKYHDDDAGCYYYGYRWYDPWSGRWLSRDPIEEEGGLNLYGFVGNDGVDGVDPVGEKGRVIVAALGSGDEIMARSDIPIVYEGEMDSKAVRFKSENGTFDAQAGVLSSDPCDIYLLVRIWINYGCASELLSGTEVEYFDHHYDAWGSTRLKGGGTSVSGGYHMPEGAAVAHERAHADTWWDVMREPAIKALQPFLDAGNGASLIDRLGEVDDAYIDAEGENTNYWLKTAAAANEATLYWFDHMNKFRYRCAYFSWGKNKWVRR